MGKKLQQIHYARVVQDVATQQIVQRIRDAAMASIQIRIMRKLVNQVDRLAADELDVVLNSIDCLPTDWRELVETLNAE